MSWRRKPDGSIVSLVRDAQHRVKEIDYPANGSIGGFMVTTQFDEFGRVTNRTDSNGTTMLTWDDLNRPLSITPPAPQQGLTFSYDGNTTFHRWTTSVALVGVPGTVAYQYKEDSKGRLAEIDNALGQPFVRQFDPDGKLVLTTYPNNIQEEHCYTTNDLLASILVRKADSSVQDAFAYYYTDGLGGHDLAGHILREIDGFGKVHAFKYDNLYRLVQESHADFGPPGNQTISYGYDANDNRTSKSGSFGTDYYGVDANNKLLWVNRGSPTPPVSQQASPYTLFSYDADGRLIRRDRRYDNYGGQQQILDLAWDGDDRLRSVKQGATSLFSALYNGDGLRVSQTDPWATTRNYTWGPGGILYQDLGNTLFTPGLAHNSGGVNRFYHGDWIGSTRYLSDSSGSNFTQGLRFDAFGGRSYTAPGGTDPYFASEFQFAGGFGYQTAYADGVSQPGLGLEYLQQRYYDPAVGRFISADPIGIAGGLNSYLYASGDPAGRVDPLGLDDRPAWSYSLENFFGGLGMLAEGAGGFIAGGGSAVLTGPGLVVTAPPLAVGGLVAGGGGGLVMGRSFGRGLANGILYIVARGGTYVLRNGQTGEVCRTGRTNDHARRAAEHLRNPETADLDYIAQHWTDDPAVRRGLEQMLYDANPDALLNKIRPISLKNPRLEKYIEAALRFFLGVSDE